MDRSEQSVVGDVRPGMTAPADAIRVLHVDDEPEFATTAARFLEREDGRLAVGTETSASSGLERLAEETFDCVVSDYDMPGEDGIEFLAAVREDDPELPFILYTGKGSEEIASEAISAGVTDYLQKDFGTDQYTILANRITNAVGQYRANRAVEHQRRHFRTLVEESSDAILIVDAFAEISFATPSAEHVLGRTPEELVGTNGLDPIHPDDVDRAAALFAELVEHPGERRSVVFRYRRPDDTYIQAEARGRNLLADPVVEGIVIYTRDLTDRVERERELEETNGLLSSLFDTLPAGVVAEDADRTVMAVNRRTFDLFGLDGSPEDIVGSDCVTFAEAVSDQFADGAAFVERIETVVDTDEPVDRESIRLADGRTVERSHRPIELPDGNGHLWTYRDVTERDERRRILTRQEAFLHNSPDLFFVLDEAGVVTYQSHSSADILGYEVPDLLGDAPLDYIHPADRDSVEADFERLLREPNEPVTSEYRFLTPSGEYRWYENRAVNRLDDPDVAGVLVVNRDVTERKRRERELQRRNDRLAEFTSIVSHDLRNPLQVARGRLELAHDPGTDADLDAVSDAHGRMECLIEDLLALAQDGDAIAETEPVPLDGLVAECWDNVSTAGARLVVDTDRVVEGDRSRLRQLFENLFRNSVDHAGDDVTITVGAFPDGFFVADDGPGIPPERREVVFDAGYSTSPTGSGLGLRIVEQVAHAHGWAVSLTGTDEGHTSKEPRDSTLESSARSDSSTSPGARFEFTGVAIVEQ